MLASGSGIPSLASRRSAGSTAITLLKKSSQVTSILLAWTFIATCSIVRRHSQWVGLGKPSSFVSNASTAARRPSSTVETTANAVCSRHLSAPTKLWLGISGIILASPGTCQPSSQRTSALFSRSLSCSAAHSCNRSMSRHVLPSTTVVDERRSITACARQSSGSSEINSETASRHRSNTLSMSSLL